MPAITTYLLTTLKGMTCRYVVERETSLNRLGYLPFKKDDKSQLEALSSLVFEILPKSKTGQEKHALLNEDQTIFLLTLIRNTEQVVEFKYALTKLFSTLRSKQAAIDSNKAKAIWHQNRDLGKLQRHDLTDVIQAFVAYAKAQGSTGAHHYYTNITKAVSKSLGYEVRDVQDECQLHVLSTAELVVEQALLAGIDLPDYLPDSASEPLGG